MNSGRRRLQVGTGGEWPAFGRVGIPDHQTFEVLSRLQPRLFASQLDHAFANHMHLGFQRDHQYLVVLVPDPYRFVFMERDACGFAVLLAAAQ